MQFNPIQHFFSCDICESDEWIRELVARYMDETFEIHATILRNEISNLISQAHEFHANLEWLGEHFGTPRGI